MVNSRAIKPPKCRMKRCILNTLKKVHWKYTDGNGASVPAFLLGFLQVKKVGGEGGIRTHGRISPTHAFQACSLNRSDTSPDKMRIPRKAGRRVCLLHIPAAVEYQKGFRARKPVNVAEAEDGLRESNLRMHMNYSRGGARRWK